MGEKEYLDIVESRIFAFRDVVCDYSALLLDEPSYYISQWQMGTFTHNYVALRKII